MDKLNKLKDDREIGNFMKTVTEILTNIIYRQAQLFEKVLKLELSDSHYPSKEEIKKNKRLLRQLTYLNNEVKKLKGRIKNLENRDSYYPVGGVGIVRSRNSEEEIKNIKIGLTD